MASSLLTEDQLMKLLSNCEDELVEELCKVDPANRNYPILFSENLCQVGVISSDVCNSFSFLDGGVKFQLQIRYLLRLVKESIKGDLNIWGKFLTVLYSIEGVSELFKIKLNRAISEMNVERADVMTSGLSVELAKEDTDVEEMILNHGDVGLLSELLVQVSHKWKEIALSLGLKQHEIAELSKETSNNISLSSTIALKIGRDKKLTLLDLKRALGSGMVGESEKAQNLGREFIEAKEQSTSAATKHCLLKMLPDIQGENLIYKISSHQNEVADGKSTLLHVQVSSKECVSYQWKKDGQPLANSSTYSGVDSDLLVVSHARQGTEGEYTCCMSRQGKEVCSNKITLTVKYESDKKQLLKLYATEREIPRDSWSPVVAKKFINLALIKSSQDHKHACDYSVCGDADDIIAKKESIEYQEAFGEYKSRELILLEGRPGSGKTTLVHEIISDWRNGKILIKARLVFLVTLRELTTYGSDKTLLDLLRLFYSNDRELKTVRNDIEKNNGEEVCFIIDGLDEYQAQDEKVSIIYRLLNRTYLHQAMIIVSSRPSATKMIKKEFLTRHVEIFGFSKQQIMEYIDNFPFTTLSAGTSTVQEKLKNCFKCNPNVFDMCYLPVHAAMICFLFDSNSDNVSYTQTKIYEQFTLSMIHRHFMRQDIEIKVQSLQKLQGKYKRYFNDLCYLACNMTIQSKQVISQEELNSQVQLSDYHGDEFSLGLLTAYNTLGPTGLHCSYTFLHLTFQEFLAAYHIANLKISQQLKKINQVSLTVRTFYCGLGLLQSKVLQKIFDGFYFDCARLLPYAFESQQKYVCDEIMECFQGSLSIFGTLAPTDIHAMGYVISNTSKMVTEVRLDSEYHYDDDRIAFLLEQLSKQNLCSLRTLKIRPTICDNEVSKLVDVLKCANNLNELELCLKNISSDDAQCLVDQMQLIPSLKFLTVSYSAPAISIKVLLNGLIPITVKILRMSLVFEDVDSEGVKAIGSGLELLTDTTSFYEFELTSSMMCPESATCLASGLCHCTNLWTLDLSHNNIGCDSVDSLCDGLKLLIRLTDLNLSHNNIGDEGASSVGHILQHLTSLYRLHLSHNNIGSHGMYQLASGLQSLTEMWKLDLSHNNISSEGAASLANVLKYLTDVRYLYLSHNNIGPDGMTSLAGGIIHLPELHVLDISHNNIDLERAKTIITSLKVCHDMRKAVISVEEEQYRDCIFVHGLVSPDDTTAIADLVAAARSEKEERELDLGFESIDIPRETWFRRLFRRGK